MFSLDRLLNVYNFHWATLKILRRCCAGTAGLALILGLCFRLLTAHFSVETRTWILRAVVVLIGLFIASTCFISAKQLRQEDDDDDEYKNAARFYVCLGWAYIMTAFIAASNTYVTSE
jgi:hypothetical protein